MRIIAGVLLSMLLHGVAVAQTIEEKHHRILLVLDASQSMNERFDSTHTRYQAAAAFIIQLMDSIYKRNDEVEFGLRVYGHQYPAGANQCYDTKSEVMFSRDNYEQMKMRLADIKPKGISNTYAALSDALVYDIERHDGYYYHLVLLTDGGEACSGDICAIVSTPSFKGINGLCVIGMTDKQYYDCLSKGLNLSQGGASLISELVNTCSSVPIRKSKRYPTNNTVKEINTGYDKNLSVDKQLSFIKTPAIKFLRVDQKPLKLVSRKMATTPQQGGYGFLKINDVSSVTKINLLYMQDGIYAPLDKLNIDNLYKNQVLQLMAGEYELNYLIKIKERFTKPSFKKFKIVKNMITEIEVN